MKKKFSFCMLLFLVLTGLCGADENDKLSHVMRVQADGETVVDSQSRLKVLLAVSTNLGKEIIIKPRENCKKSVHDIYNLAKEGKTEYSGHFGIGSEVSTIKKKWGKPQDEDRVENQRMMMYTDRSVSYKYPTQRWRVKDVSCHSFYGAPRLPSMSEFRTGLGKPYKEYNLLQMIEEGKKRGVDIVKKLQVRGIIKKTSDVKSAVQAGEFDFKVVVYKADDYFFYMMECRIRNCTEFYRSIGVRTDDDILNDPWII